MHSEDWSDWADAQADLSLHWVHRSFCWFCPDCYKINGTRQNRPRWSVRIFHIKLEGFSLNNTWHAKKVCKKTNPWMGLQGDQVPRIFRAGLDKRLTARKYFTSSGSSLLDKWSDWQSFYQYFYELQLIFVSKGCRFCQRSGFMMSNYWNLSIFTTARKNIFGKTITLDLHCLLRPVCPKTQDHYGTSDFKLHWVPAHKWYINNQVRSSLSLSGGTSCPEGVGVIFTYFFSIFSKDFRDFTSSRRSLFNFCCSWKNIY